MAKKQRSGASYKAQYTAYKQENRAKKNKINRLGKRLLENPNDKGADAAIKVVMAKVSFRKKPGDKGWLHPQEQRLFSLMKKTDNAKELENLNLQLKKIREVYNSKKPSAILKPVKSKPIESMADKLYSLGLINEKRYKSFRQSMGSLR